MHNNGNRRENSRYKKDLLIETETNKIRRANGRPLKSTQKRSLDQLSNVQCTRCSRRMVCDDNSFLSNVNTHFPEIETKESKVLRASQYISKKLERFSIECQKQFVSVLLWFCFTSLCDLLKNPAPLSQPFRSKTQTNQSRLARARTRFPALDASNMYLLRVLIGSLGNLCLL